MLLFLKGIFLPKTSAGCSLITFYIYMNDLVAKCNFHARVLKNNFQGCVCVQWPIFFFKGLTVMNISNLYCTLVH